MAIKGGGFEKSSKASSEIPSSSMADIAFLLLIFFMVTTVFQRDRDRPIEWAEAESAQKIDEKQKNIGYKVIEGRTSSRTKMLELQRLGRKKKAVRI